MAILAVFDKQPADVQDYDVSFASWLTNLTDTGASIVVAASPGITLVSSALSAGVVKVWLSGGTDKNVYTITINLTSTGGRVKQVEFQVKVKDK